MRMECLRGAQPCFAAYRIEKQRWTVVGPLIAALFCASGAGAQQIPSPTPQFDVTGFIQAATLDGSICPSVTDSALWGGTVTVNGVKLIVPCNTIIQMPANTLAWSDLFPTSSPLATGGFVSFANPVGSSAAALNGSALAQVPGQTGLALADATAPGTTNPGGPYPSFEIRAIGNVVNGQYIVGLIVPISQQSANLGTGMITCIDYANGLLYVGGDPAAVPGVAPCTLTTGAPNGAAVQINDPIGRWGLQHSPDPRFSGDTNNTTVHSASGYPMCVPRVDPALHPAPVGSDPRQNDGGDPQCPAGNRPLNGDARFPLDPYLPPNAPLRIFDMPPPPLPIEATPACGLPACNPAQPAIPAAAPVFPDSRFQLPFMVGDFIDYSGTLARDALGNSYISAHTVLAHLGVFTAPHTQPAYVNVETILLGAGGTPVSAIQIEPTTRIFIVGFTTDPSALIDINAVDVDPCTGAETLRLLGTVDPATQVVRGRFRFHVLGGSFMPPTREMVIASHDGPTVATAPFDLLAAAFPVGVANGLGSGQYRLPNFDFIFPENIKLGEPLVPNNFQDFPFLARGSGPLFGSGSVVGQLIPWPGIPTPPAVTCVTTPNGTGAAPVADAGFSFAINTSAAASEPIFGAVTQDPNATAPAITWTQTAGPPVTLTNANTLNPSFSTVDPLTGAFKLPVGTVLTFQLSVTDNFSPIVGGVAQPSTSTMSVTVMNTTDTIAPTAVWRASRVQFNVKKGVVGNRVGIKGGLLQITGVDSITDPTIQMLAPGWGRMEVSPVLGLPTYIIKLTGVPAPPDSVTIRSSLGAEALNVPVRIR